MVSVAAKQLAELLQPRLGMTQADLARRLDVSPQSVSAWLRGKAKPTPDLLAKLEDLTGIPMRAWTEDAPDSDPKPEPETH